MKKTLKRDCNKFSKEIDPATDKRILESTIPAGTQVDVEFPLMDTSRNPFTGMPVQTKNPLIMILSANGITVRCRSTHWNKYFKTNSKLPSDKMIETWVYDGVCKSLGGNRVEPDGWSFDGTPSWLLAMGMI